MGRENLIWGVGPNDGIKNEEEDLLDDAGINLDVSSVTIILVPASGKVVGNVESVFLCSDDTHKTIKGSEEG